MTENLRVVNTLKNNITKWFEKRMALTKSGKAGIMVKESTDKEGSMKYLAVILVSFIMISGFAVFAESAPAKVDIQELQRELKKIQETGSGLRMVLFFEKQKDFADAGSVFADMYQDSLTDLEEESKNIVEKFFSGKDTAQALDEAIRHIGSLKKEDQASFNLFTSYLLEKMGKAAPAELSQLESRIAGYEIERASVDLKDRGLLDKFKEWYLKRYETILKTFLEKKDAKKLKKDRNQVLFCIDLWSSLKWREKKGYKIDPETQQAFNSAWSQAHSDYKYNKKYVEAINGFKKAYGIWAEKAIEQGVNHYIGLCYEELKDYDSALEAYKQSIYKEVNFYSASLSHCKSVCYYLIPQKEQYISKKISFFENLFENPTTLVNSAEDFKFQCLRTIGSIYSLLEEDNIIKEKYLLESIKFYIRVRGQFSNLDNRIEIQSRIYDAYNRINRFYGSGKRKKEYYLEMVKNEEYSVSNALYYSPDAPYRSMARIFYDLADECILTRNEKTLYYNESVRTAGEAADKLSIENASDIVNLFFDLDTYSAFSNAFGYADSIESKYNAGQKYLAVIEKQEKRLPTGDSKTDLISRQIYAISDLITNLSLCSKEKPEELYLKLCSMIQYASSYTDVSKYAYSEMSGYFYAGVNMSQGEAATNSEYLEKAAQKAQQIINGEFSEGTKKDAKKKLLEILFYSRKYDSLISECMTMLGSNTLGVEDGFLYQLTGKCYFEKSLSVTGDEAEKYRKSAQENYNKAATGSGHYELGIDQALLLSQLGNSKEAFKKIKEFISQTGPEDQIPTRLYKYIMLAKEMLKIGFTPDILDLGENDTQIYTATIALADGTTAETTAGASGWKWSAEGNGTIVEQNGNVMKYKAGKDSNSDIITAECNVDLKQVLKIRGDFDAIVEIKGEISAPIFFVADTNLSSPFSSLKRVKGISVSNKTRGENAAPNPIYATQKKATIIFKTVDSKDKVSNAIEFIYMEPYVSMVKGIDCVELIPNSNIYYNNDESLEVRIEDSVISKKGLQVGDSLNIHVISPRVKIDQPLKIVNANPLICSNMVYNSEECGDITNLSESDLAKVRIALKIPGKKRIDGPIEIIVKSFEENGGNEILIDKKRLEIKEISTENIYITKKTIRCVLSKSASGPLEEILLVSLPEDFRFKSVRAYWKDLENNETKEVDIRLFGFAFIHSGIYSADNSIDSITKNLNTCGYVTNPLKNSQYKNIKKHLVGSEIIYMSVHGGYFYENPYSYPLNLYYALARETDKYFSWELPLPHYKYKCAFLMQKEDFEEIIKNKPFFVFINACNSAPPQQPEPGNSDMSKAIEAFIETICKKEIAGDTIYMGWKIPTKLTISPSEAFLDPTGIVTGWKQGVITPKAIEFAEKFFENCAQEKKIYKAIEDAIQGNTDKSYIRSMLFTAPTWGTSTLMKNKSLYIK